MSEPFFKSNDVQTIISYRFGTQPDNVIEPLAELLNLKVAPLLEERDKLKELLREARSVMRFVKIRCADSLQYSSNYENEFKSMGKQSQDCVNKIDESELVE